MKKTQDEQILEVIRAMPGVTNKETVELTGIAYGNVTARMSVMRKRGLVKTKENRHYLGDGKPTVPPKLKMKKSTKAELRITELEELVVSLTAKLAEAIAKYPDLAIKPKVLEARKIVADVFNRKGDKQKAHEALTGKLDESPIMEVALLAGAE